jgi:septum site-determining protein MinD
MLAVAGGKGGAGKTTTALGLAVSFTAVGREPLVVDADCDMPDLHLRAGTDLDPGLDAVVERGIDRAVQQSSRAPGVAVVSAGSRDAVGPAVERLRGWQGPVLVDCPPGFARQLGAVFAAVDRTVLVTTDREQAVEDAVKTAAVARVVGAEPSGLVVRATERESRVAHAFECDASVRVPSVAEPLSAPRVRAGWRRLRDAIPSGR